MSDLTFTVSVDMSNAIFDDSPGDELARILRWLANDVASADEHYIVNSIDALGIRDINGNTVGSVHVR